MWKELAFLFIGFTLGGFSFTWLTLRSVRELIGDDYEINKPKVKGENNILRVFQSNKKDKDEKQSVENKKKRFGFLKRKNKK